MENNEHNNCKNHENMNEYSALRSEILTVEQNGMTCKMYMYTVFFAIISFAFKYRILFIVALVVLLVFQSFLNFNLWMLRKVSIYIELFFEKERNDIHWETMQTAPEYEGIDDDFHDRFSVWISDHAAGMLALIAASFDFYFIISEIINRGGIFCGGISFADITLMAEIIVIVLLCVAVLVVTHQSDVSMDNEIRAAIRKYKENIDSGISK